MKESRDQTLAGETAAPWRSQVGIPIRNLWVLLAYASGIARFLDPLGTRVDEDADLPDVLGRVLALAVERRLRRGLSRGYELRSAELDRVKGRIDWLNTETGELLTRGRIACRYEDLTHDTPRNRLVATALLAAGKKVQAADLARNCLSLARTLLDAGVTPVRPSRLEMSRERFGRNDAQDEVVVRTAELIMDMKLPSENAGDTKLSRLDHDEVLLRQIFEKAVAGFYLLELHGRDGWRVGRQSVFDWHGTDATAGLHTILPKMHADIVLQKDSVRRIVLDTKFTGIVSPRVHGSEGLKSAHIYQIYSYIRSQAGMNDALANKTEGILLHPSIDTNLDEAVTIQGHRIRFVTVDLAAEASVFRERLREIAVVPI
ncbi:5-methylcytosine-specific restriction enzyme subunit McrC [Rhizobium sp. PP-F2F-G38]|nr:5-methylcytosine-specific restriction enzyme subunit McrC [Rhizobium sp. PP-F2F-G38]